MKNIQSKMGLQGLGCMGMSEFYNSNISQEAATQLIKTAQQAGVKYFDTADCYGPHTNEVLVGNAVTAMMQHGVPRDQIFIATKFGIKRSGDPHQRGVDNSYDYTLEACEDSLERLGESGLPH